VIPAAADILLDELEESLLRRRVVTIEGFGRFEIRAGGARVVVELEPALHRTPDRGSVRARCPTLTGAAARRACWTTARMEQQLVALVDELVAAALGTGLPQPIGRLGLLRLRGAAHMLPPFAPSRYLAARIDGVAAPGTVEYGTVSQALARAPARDADAVRAALARLGYRATAAAADTAARISSLAAGAPPLLAVLASHRLDVCHRPTACLGVDARVFEHPRTFLDARDAHERWMRAHDEPPGIPFARSLDGNVWCYCTCAGARDRWVYLAGRRSRSPYHRHDATFTDWLAASLVIDELDRAAAGDSLTAEDLRRVSAHLHEIVRSSAFASALCAHLPY
jgi:hypothetical protein